MPDFEIVRIRSNLHSAVMILTWQGFSLNESFSSEMKHQIPMSVL
jgi:hypothetical protein